MRKVSSDIMKNVVENSNHSRYYEKRIGKPEPLQGSGLKDSQLLRTHVNLECFGMYKLLHKGLIL